MIMLEAHAPPTKAYQNSQRRIDGDVARWLKEMQSVNSSLTPINELFPRDSTIYSLHTGTKKAIKSDAGYRTTVNRIGEAAYQPQNQETDFTQQITDACNAAMHISNPDGSTTDTHILCSLGTRPSDDSRYLYLSFELGYQPEGFKGFSVSFNPATGLVEWKDPETRNDYTFPALEAIQNYVASGGTKIYNGNGQEVQAQDATVTPLPSETITVTPATSVTKEDGVPKKSDSTSRDTENTIIALIGGGVALFVGRWLLEKLGERNMNSEEIATLAKHRKNEREIRKIVNKHKREMQRAVRPTGFWDFWRQLFDGELKLNRDIVKNATEDAEKEARHKNNL